MDCRPEWCFTQPPLLIPHSSTLLYHSNTQEICHCFCIITPIFGEDTQIIWHTVCVATEFSAWVAGSACLWTQQLHFGLEYSEEQLLILLLFGLVGGEYTLSSCLWDNLSLEQVVRESSKVSGSININYNLNSRLRLCRSVFSLDIFSDFLSRWQDQGRNLHKVAYDGSKSSTEVQALLNIVLNLKHLI